MSDSNWLCFSDLTLDFEYPYFIFFSPKNSFETFESE